MGKQNYNVLGVMSGTSLDGVDLAHINLSYTNEKWTYDIVNAITVPYSTNWAQRLKAAVDFNTQQLTALNEDYTILLASVIRNFIAENAITGLDAICSHGHTILHQPQNGVTLQIGNLPAIAQFTGQRVVCDFRIQDVKLGGQGAPLVPIGDRLLFADYDYCINLGGFSNISFEDIDKRIAYDICPVNTVLNYYANRLGEEYDAGGKIAAAGNIIPEMLEQLNSLEYYSLPYPKSLGFEFVKAVILPLTENYNAAERDILSTFTQHIAIQISKAIQKEEASILITGGGAYNAYLINKLKSLCPGSNIVIPNDKTIQFKEALIFGLLGVLRLRDEINVLSSVTGAIKNHSSGTIYEA